MSNPRYSSAMHPLDNAAWNALHSAQSHLARGEGRAIRYDQGHAIFAAVPDHSPEALAALGQLVADTGPAIVAERAPLPPVPGTRVESNRMAVQMVAEAIVPGREVEFLPLGDLDAAEMLALATLTKPGPYFERTHRLGEFIGVRDGERLVAMAGERMRLTGFTEVSGVCTHPDFRGRGLAGALMRTVARRMIERGEVPFLHAYADNAGAIALYEALGFRIRCEIPITLLVTELGRPGS